MEMAKEGPNHKLLKGSPPYSSSSRFWGSFFCFLNHFWPCLQVSLWNFAIGGAVDELQVRARKGHTVRNARVRTANLGVHFLCLWVTLDIVYRSPFGIFAIGGAADELQVRARSDRCGRAPADVLEGWFFQHFIGIQFSWGSAERIINIGTTVKE